MRIFFYLLVFIVGHASAQQAGGRIQNEGRSESENGLLVVHGASFRLRAAVTQDGEELMETLGKLTGELKGGDNPIVVELFPPVRGKKSMVRPEFFIIPQSQGGGYRLQINVRLGRGNSFVQKDLRREMLKMLVIERSLRGQEVLEAGAELEVQPWLLDGLEEALLWQENRGDRRVYLSLAQSGGWMEVEKLVEVNETESFDALGRELFRASAGALLMALLDQADGKKAMISYLSEAALHQGEELSLIRRHFPEVNLGRKGLEKWWSLAVVKMAEKPLSESMTIPETEVRLEQILRLHFKSEDGSPELKPLDAWIEMATLPIAQRVEVVRPTVDLLTALSYRCFPSYRELIAGYLRVLSDMAKGEPEKIDETLINLAAFRKGELDRHEQTVDLLDWYHLSTVKEDSGQFSDYLEIKKRLKEAELDQNDPVSQYVDRMQRLFERDPGGQK